MIQKEDLYKIKQLIDSIDKAVDSLEKTAIFNDVEGSLRIKETILSLHLQLSKQLSRYAK